MSGGRQSLLDRRRIKILFLNTDCLNTKHKHTALDLDPRLRLCLSANGS